MIKYLKKKWGIKSTGHFWLIFFIFGLTGTSMLFLKPPVFKMLGIDTSIDAWLYVFLYILIVTPLYFITLLIVGALLGQFRFFWKFEKKTLSGIKRIFTQKK